MIHVFSKCQETPCKVDPAKVSTIASSAPEDTSESNLSHTNWQPTEGSQGHPELCILDLKFFIVSLHVNVRAKSNRMWTELIGSCPYCPIPCDNAIDAVLALTCSGSWSEGPRQKSWRVASRQVTTRIQWLILLAQPTFCNLLWHRSMSRWKPGLRSPTMFVLRTWALPKWKWMSILPPWSLRSPSWARQEPASGKVGRIMVQKGANSEQFVKESKLGTTLTRQELSLAIVFRSLRDQDCPHRMFALQFVSTKHSHKITYNMQGRRIRLK